MHCPHRNLVLEKKGIKEEKEEPYENYVFHGIPTMEMIAFLDSLDALDFSTPVLDPEIPTVSDPAPLAPVPVPAPLAPEPIVPLAQPAPVQAKAVQLEDVRKPGPSREIISIKVIGREKRILIRDNTTGIISVIRKPI
jgi:hypothetical protein